MDFSTTNNMGCYLTEEYSA